MIILRKYNTKAKYEAVQILKVIEIVNISCDALLACPFSDMKPTNPLMIETRDKQKQRSPYPTMLCANVIQKYSRERFSVSSSSFLVFKLVLLEADLFDPAAAAKGIKSIIATLNFTA